MDLQCRRCHKPIAADGINIQQMIAKCQHCNAVFTFNNAEAQSETEAKAAAERKQRGVIPTPARWQSRHEAGSLILTHRWYRPLYIFLVIFCVVWNGFLGIWYSLFLKGGIDAGPLSWIFLLLPLIHVALGIGITYFTIAGFLNTTSIIAERGQLTVKHRPLPWLHAGTISNLELDQLYCKETRQESKGQTYFRYRLCALLKNGRERVLISNMDSPDDALYLEAELEKFLGITDRAVAGEYKS